MAVTVEDVTKVPFYNFHDPIPSPPPTPLSRKLPTFNATYLTSCPSILSDREPEPTSAPTPIKEPSTTPITPSTPQPPTPRKSIFFTLPTELRLEIYSHLLISHHKHPPGRFLDLTLSVTDNKHPTPSTSSLKKKEIHLSTPNNNQIKRKTNYHLHPNILLTCKQIYTEAHHILYTHNTFSITHPNQLHHHITHIGPYNTSLLRSLHIFVPWNTSEEIWPWIVLLNNLSEKATGLQHLRIGWGTNTQWLENSEPGDKSRGLGDNILFVHALARLRQLRRLTIYGFFGVNWPGYLCRELGSGGTVVEVECCGFRPFGLLDGYEVVGDGKGVDEEKRVRLLLEEARALWEENLMWFRLFQEGTMGVVP